MAGVVKVFNFLAIALAQRHKGADAIRTLSLHALRISQVTGNGIPYFVTPVPTIREALFLHQVHWIAVFVNMNYGILIVHRSTNIWNWLTPC